MIVTGASSGIGACLAADLADRGAVVVGVARRRDRLEEVMDRARRSSPASRAVVADLAEEGAAEALVAEVQAAGGVGVLVNNAGIPMRVHATRLTVEQVRRAVEVNFLAAARLTLAALPGMLASGGHIVNIGSVAGRVGSPREAAYTASKFALAGWSESLAADLVGTPVRVHLVNPGPIRTEIWNKLAEPASYRGRFHPPERVSAAVIRAVEGNRFEAWVPRWMGMLPFVRAAAPRGYVTAAGVFDRRAARRAR